MRQFNVPFALLQIFQRPMHQECGDFLVASRAVGKERGDTCCQPVSLVKALLEAGLVLVADYFPLLREAIDLADYLSAQVSGNYERVGDTHVSTVFSAVDNYHHIPSGSETFACFRPIGYVRFWFRRGRVHKTSP